MDDPGRLTIWPNRDGLPVDLWGREEEFPGMHDGRLSPGLRSVRAQECESPVNRAFLSLP